MQPMRTNRNNHPVSPLPSTEQVENVFEHLIRFGNTHIYHAALLAAECGLRLGEIVQLRWSDFDFDNDILTVSPHGSTHPRFIYMTKRVHREMRERCPVAGRSEFAFLPHHDRPTASERLTFSLSKTCSQLDLNLSFHSLREKFAHDAAKDGVSICELTKALGNVCRFRLNCPDTSCPSYK